jgi:SulP family sulfate permease
MAGIIHSVTLVVVLLVAAPYARFVPLAALAAVLMMVAYHMGEWHQIGRIVRLSKTDIAVWFTTFALTAFADLTVAVGVGMTLAALFYIYRIAETTTVTTLTPDRLEDGRIHVLHDKAIPDDVSVLVIHGPFLFGATEKLDAATEDLTPFAPTVIVRLRDMPAIDATGVYALERFADRLHESGRRLLLCGAMDQPRRILKGSRFLDRLGADNLLPNIALALERASATGDQQYAGHALHDGKQPP